MPCTGDVGVLEFGFLETNALTLEAAIVPAMWIEFGAEVPSPAVSDKAWIELDGYLAQFPIKPPFEVELDAIAKDPALEKLLAYVEFDAVAIQSKPPFAAGVELDGKAFDSSPLYGKLELDALALTPASPIAAGIDVGADATSPATPFAAGVEFDGLAAGIAAPVSAGVELDGLAAAIATLLAAGVEFDATLVPPPPPIAGVEVDAYDATASPAALDADVEWDATATGSGGGGSPGGVCADALPIVFDTDYSGSVGGPDDFLDAWFMFPVFTGTTYYVKVILGGAHTPSAEVDKGTSCDSLTFVFAPNTITPCDTFSVSSDQNCYVHVHASLLGAGTYTVRAGEGSCP